MATLAQAEKKAKDDIIYSLNTIIIFADKAQLTSEEIEAVRNVLAKSPMFEELRHILGS